ncbi:MULTISPECIES: hypothetical protein [Streptomyces]|uniref:Uncharacterized protein n=2 Tax=Streptomyces TaxID=1883 RepID=A0ABV9IPD8_9ACTN
MRRCWSPSDPALYAVTAEEFEAATGLIDAVVAVGQAPVTRED